MDTSAPYPAATVLLATYNARDYLAQSIASILNQTFHSFEFIIIDDGSTDGSAALIQTFDDSRIKLLRNPHNQGKAASLNRALVQIRGRYIFLMDADDIAMPQRLDES